MTGKAWVFGDNIDTDVLAPGHLMKLSPADLASHCLEAIDPNFAKNIVAGDVIFAGRNFGLGSSREQAAISLKELGVAAVIAPSVARIFFRNAINLGLPVLTGEWAGLVDRGDEVIVDSVKGTVINRTQSKTIDVSPLPQALLAIIDAGGLMEQLRMNLAAH